MLPTLSKSSQDYLKVLGNANHRALDSQTFAQQQCNDPTQDWYGLCQRFTRLALSCPQGAPSAAAAWDDVPEDLQHTWYYPPVGVPVYWSGGKTGYGHAALSDGNGQVWSTDILRKGKVDLVHINLIHNRWNLTYLGWTETCNGTVVYTNPDAVSSTLEEETTTE